MKKYRDILCLLLGIVILLFFVGNNCPIEKFVGIPCPGCNMFTAFYWLLKGKYELALYYHPTIIPLLVYGLGCAWMYLKYRKSMKTMKLFRISTMIFFIIFLGIYVYRMMVIFPEIPMQFNHQAKLVQIFHLF